MTHRVVWLPLEVVILVIAGIVVLTTGVLLFPVYQGALPYFENGLYGLLLIIFALQTMTLGRTPFGDLSRSKLVLALGLIVASVGMVSCLVPIPIALPRILLFICFGPGGLSLFLQLIFAEDKSKRWAKYGGIFRQLIYACGSVYVLSMAIAALLFNQRLLTTPMTAIATIVFGLAICYLAAVLLRIDRAYPDSAKVPDDKVKLSTEQVMILFTSIFMVIIGIVLIPVNLGILPFSANAQLGVLMIIFSIQMLAFGNTPVGVFPRTWLVLAFGLVFALLGAVSCIIPHLLVAFLTTLVGTLNILGGVISLVKMVLARDGHANKPRETVPPILTRLFVTQLTLSLLQTLFGTSMLVPGVVPGLVIGVILAANGCVLLYLLHVLRLLDTLRSGTEGAK